MAASVFDIHPLVEAIARNLSPEELCCCLRVSYAWRTNFSPYLWRRIRLYSEQHYGKFNTPLTLGALARRTNQVQIVETNIPRLLDLLSDTYPLYNLSTLRVGALGCSSSSLVQLLGQSTNLQTLELLGYFGPGPVVEQFLSTLRSHPRLRELSVTTGSYTYTPKAMIWRLLLSCGNLETIFAKTHFDTKEFPPTSEALMAEVRELTGSETPSFKVKDLTIGPSLYSGDDLFASFLRFCPNVERLSIPVVYYAAISQVVTEDPYPNILRSTMKSLRHLVVCSGGLVTTSATALIHSCPTLESYRGHGCEENPQFVISTLLNKHHDTLTVVELSGHGLFWTVTGLVQSFLCMCPHLRTFRARGSIKTVSTVQSSTPSLHYEVDTACWGSSLWTCLNLNILEISFRSRLLDTSTRDSQGADGLSLEQSDGIDYSPEFVPEFLVLQLGRLKKLEGLVLRRVTQMGLGVEAKLQALHEELYEMGRQQVTHLFETLSTLPEMRRVELQGMREAMVILEIDKAKQCWNYIEALSYYDENIRYY